MEKGIRIPISFIRTRQIVTEGRVAGKKMLFLIDTGASESVFHLETAQELGLGAQKLESQTGAGVGSSNMTLFQLPPTEITLGNRQWWLKRPAAMDLSHVLFSLKRYRARQVSIILGADLLRRYRAVIDYGAKEMWMFPEAE